VLSWFPQQWDTGLSVEVSGARVVQAYASVCGMIAGKRLTSSACESQSSERRRGIPSGLQHKAVVDKSPFKVVAERLGQSAPVRSPSAAIHATPSRGLARGRVDAAQRVCVASARFVESRPAWDLLGG